jgi:glycine/D-amino acid oxidase-like deaminating enzyme
MKAKILIVGGGVMGTSLALRAAQKTDPLTEPVVLLERTEIGAGSTGGSGAILRQFYADRMIALMARDSLRTFSRFEAQTGRSIGFTRAGVLTLAGPEQPESQQLVRERVPVLQETGIDIHVLEGADIAKTFAGLHVQPGSVAAWEPDAGFVDAIATVGAFAALARSYGAVTRLAVEAQEILVEDGRVVGARTTEGEYTAEQVVVVGGPWSAGLLKPLGVDIPLRTAVPENYFFGMPEAEVESEEDDVRTHGALGFDIEDPSEKGGDELTVMTPHGLHPVLVDLENDFYVRCEPPNKRTRTGRASYDYDSVIEDPDARSDDVDAEAHARARTMLEQRLPEYEGRPDAGTQTSWYTLTPDANPVVGPIPSIEGLFVATGFSGHGFKLAPSIGEGLTQMLFDEPVTAFESEVFAPMRFQGEVTWGGRFGL